MKSISAIGGGGVCPLRSIGTAGSSENPGSTGGGVVAAVPSEGGILALLSPLADRPASLSVEVPPGNCDCQSRGRAGGGGLSSSSLATFTLDRERDFESFRRPLDFFSFSSSSAGARLHSRVSAVSPGAAGSGLLPFASAEPDRCRTEELLQAFWFCFLRFW